MLCSGKKNFFPFITYLPCSIKSIIQITLAHTSTKSCRILKLCSWMRTTTMAKTNACALYNNIIITPNSWLDIISKLVFAHNYKISIPSKIYWCIIWAHESQKNERKKWKIKNVGENTVDFIIETQRTRISTTKYYGRHSVNI